MTLQLTETESEFRSRLGLNNVLRVSDCGRYWELEVKSNLLISPEDFSRLNIGKIVSYGNGHKCVYVPKL
jgi:hypothetical protein